MMSPCWTLLVLLYRTGRQCVHPYPCSVGHCHAAAPGNDADDADDVDEADFDEID